MRFFDIQIGDFLQYESGGMYRLHLITDCKEESFYASRAKSIYGLRLSDLKVYKITWAHETDIINPDNNNRWTVWRDGEQIFPIIKRV